MSIKSIGLIMGGSAAAVAVLFGAIEPAIAAASGSGHSAVPVHNSVQIPAAMSLGVTATAQLPGFTLATPSASPVVLAPH